MRPKGQEWRSQSISRFKNILVEKGMPYMKGKEKKFKGLKIDR
jgi:hypothetical protein